MNEQIKYFMELILQGYDLKDATEMANVKEYNMRDILTVLYDTYCITTKTYTKSDVTEVPRRRMKIVMKIQEK